MAAIRTEIVCLSSDVCCKNQSLDDLSSDATAVKATELLDKHSCYNLSMLGISYHKLINRK